MAGKKHVSTTKLNGSTTVANGTGAENLLSAPAAGASGTPVSTEPAASYGTKLGAAKTRRGGASRNLLVAAEADPAEPLDEAAIVPAVPPVAIAINVVCGDLLHVKSSVAFVGRYRKALAFT